MFPSSRRQAAARSVSEAWGLSLLAKATPAAIAREPFAHLVVRNALPDALCRQLLEEMPSLDVLAEGRGLGSNERVSYPCHAACANPAVSSTWKRFLQEHVSQSFLDRLMQLFGPALTQVHPRFEGRCAPVDRLRAGMRGIDDLGRVDVLLDAQVCANSPVRQAASSVRGAHLDTPDKLFVGLYYLRHPDDDSVGGELQLYGPRRTARSPWLGGFASQERFELCRTVPYENNVLVLFLNSIDSVHLVTPRSPTRYPRLLVNLIGAVREPIWRYQGTLRDRLQQRLFWKSGLAMPWTRGTNSLMEQRR